MIGKGYVHVYTGNGKGKTTCALGLLLRAYGAGAHIFLGQFLKSSDYSELNTLAKLSDRVTVRQYGSGQFVLGKPSGEDFKRAAAGLVEVRKALLSGRYQLVILDEANVAAGYGVLAVTDILDLIDNKPDGVELVITGRGADPRIIEKANLVTEMQEIKHYFKEGVPARRAVEK